MSDKMKELIEIPQDFIRDGNQVRLVSINLLVKELMHTLVHSSSHGVPSLRKRVSIYMSCAVSPRRYSIGIPRVLADLQGCRHRLRCHGIHRVLREAHPHPNVRITILQWLGPCADELLPTSNNILVYVSYLIHPFCVPQAFKLTHTRLRVAEVHRPLGSVQASCFLECFFIGLGLRGTRARLRDTAGRELGRDGAVSVLSSFRPLSRACYLFCLPKRAAEDDLIHPFHCRHGSQFTSHGVGNAAVTDRLAHPLQADQYN